VQELKDRLLAVQALEAARFASRGPSSPMCANPITIYSIGSRLIRAARFLYIDMMGSKRFSELCKQLEAKYGARFARPTARRHGHQRAIHFMAASRPGRAGGVFRAHLNLYAGFCQRHQG